jgi:hypothetical protein
MLRVAKKYTLLRDDEAVIEHLCGFKANYELILAQLTAIHDRLQPPTSQLNDVQQLVVAVNHGIKALAAKGVVFHEKRAVHLNSDDGIQVDYTDEAVDEFADSEEDDRAAAATASPHRSHGHHRRHSHPASGRQDRSRLPTTQHATPSRGYASGASASATATAAAAPLREFAGVAPPRYSIGQWVRVTDVRRRCSVYAQITGVRIVDWELETVVGGAYEYELIRDNKTVQLAVPESEIKGSVATRNPASPSLIGLATANGTAYLNSQTFKAPWSGVRPPAGQLEKARRQAQAEQAQQARAGPAGSAGARTGKRARMGSSSAAASVTAAGKDEWGEDEDEAGADAGAGGGRVWLPSGDSTY